MQTQSQYVLSSQQLQPGTIRGGPGNTLITTSGGHTLSTKPRPHITLNPYSTQLVENLNMMMGSKNSTLSTTVDNNSGGSNNAVSPQLMSLTQSLRRPHQGQGQLEEVVYRAVSPHGHVYWEIDPNAANYVLQHQQEQIDASTLEESICRQKSGRYDPTSKLTAEQLPLINQHDLAASHLRSSSSTEFCQNGGVSSTFVRTGAGRYNRNRMTMERRADSVNAPGGQTGNVPEQLQTQVQIRDIKPIQVSVKSSEYIEAKIRTLRRNNNNHSDVHIQE